ncbi:MAG: hypothetical protein PHZ09_11555 [Eubacteriales bacterium]|jgi:hypothetical protein|nr:hypothetical protein [Eubacteriales bacterium]
MKKLFPAIILILILTVNVIAADTNKISADTVTKGDWVGNYGSDGYFLFANSEEGCTDKLPEYVTEFSYSTIFGEEVRYHQWWEGTADDVSGIVEANAFEDAIWTDETKTSRYIPAIFDGSGVTLTIDVGSAESTVALYACDWGDDGRCVTVTLYDAGGNELDNYDLVEFPHGTYITATVTGKVEFEFAYYDAVKLGSPSNAVVSAVFFDSAPAEEPAAETAVPEADEPATEAAPAQEPAAAPQTYDSFAIIAIAAVIAFAALAKAKIKSKN